MKANELMIGDLLRYKQDFPHTHLQGKIVKVCGIRGKVDVRTINDGFFQESEHPAWLDPIPLTPEILEKNGFKFDGSGQRSMMLISEPHFSEGIRYNIYVGLKRKTIEVFAAHPIERSPNWRKSNKVYLEVCGCYVHELQHVLRLCGIDKEIEL